MFCLERYYAFAPASNAFIDFIIIFCLNGCYDISYFRRGISFNTKWKHLSLVRALQASLQHLLSKNRSTFLRRVFTVLESLCGLQYVIVQRRRFLGTNIQIWAEKTDQSLICLSSEKHVAQAAFFSDKVQRTVSNLQEVRSKIAIIIIEH